MIENCSCHCGEPICNLTSSNLVNQTFRIESRNEKKKLNFGTVFVNTNKHDVIRNIYIG